MTRLVAVSEAPTQYHVDIFRRLATTLGDEFVVLYGSPGQSTGARYASWGDRVIHNKTGLLDGYPSRFVTRHDARAVLRALRDAGVDRGSATLFHAVLPRFSRNAAVVSRALGARTLYRGSSNQAPGDGLRIALRRLRDRVSLSLFQRFCATGTTTWRYYERQAPRGKIFFSPYCVDEFVLAPIAADGADVRAQTRAALGISDDEFAVVFAGRFIPLKNVPTLIRAARRVQDDGNKRLRLLLAGDGPDKARVEAAIAEAPWQLPPIEVGFQDRPGVGRLLCAADALALPSDHETWGVVVNEALLLGAVCLVTEGVSCVPDLIRDGINGTLVAPKSIDSVADGLERLIDIATRGEHIALNRELSKLFSAENATRGVLAAAELGASPLGRPPGLAGPGAQ